MTDKGTKLSPSMASALRAVARMRSDTAPDAVLWVEFLEDLREAEPEDDGPRQGSKPAER